MGYSIKAFQPVPGSDNPLVARGEVIVGDSGKRLILLKDNQESPCPSLWRDCVKDTFKDDKRVFPKTDWENLDEFSSAQSCYLDRKDAHINTFTEEQNYIYHATLSRHKHSSVSFALVDIKRSGLEFTVLGDLVLFIYEPALDRMIAYSSMLGPDGRFDFSQPCHGLTDQVALVGTPLTRKKRLSDALVFVTTRDLANWVLESSSTDLPGTVSQMSSFGSQADFESFVNKICSKQVYRAIPFNKEQACLGVIRIETKTFAQRFKSFFSRNKVFAYTLLAVLIVICIAAVIFLLIHVFSKPDNSLLYASTVY